MSGASKLQTVAEAIRQTIGGLHALAPDTIGDRLQFSLTGWDEAAGEYTFRCETAPWMANATGTLHGGLSAAVVDQAMGFVVYCVQPGPGFSPTVQMQLSYHRPLIPGKPVTVRVWVVTRGRTLMHLRAEAAQAEALDKLCVSATAVYQYVPAPQK